jgi:hypothetical protein
MGIQVHIMTREYTGIYEHLHDRPGYGAIGPMVGEGRPLLQVKVLHGKFVQVAREIPICFNKDGKLR